MTTGTGGDVKANPMSSLRTLLSFFQMNLSPSIKRSISAPEFKTILQQPLLKTPAVQAPPRTPPGTTLAPRKQKHGPKHKNMVLPDYAPVLMQKPMGEKTFFDSLKEYFPKYFYTHAAREPPAKDPLPQNIASKSYV